MTLLKPTLIVKSLKVYQNGHEAFSCVFHKGVNVLRGRNSSGKTTIMDLLAFSLGAENIRWKPEALMCTETLVEVELNGQPACFKRSISKETLRPLGIFWGRMDESLTAGIHQWEEYPFRRSSNKINFSQAIFNALEIPLAQGDGSSNLTMHQILRVLYADQPSVHSPIFRIDNFDSALTREMVGGYLCGVFDDDLYSAQIRLRDIDNILTKKVTELKSIFLVLGRSGNNAALDYIDDRISELENKRLEISINLNELKKGRTDGSLKNKADEIKTNGLRSLLNKAKAEESEAKAKIESLELEISDSKIFVNELQERLRGLNESEITRSYFSDMQFHFCPSCLSEITLTDDVKSCHLCKSPISDDLAGAQILRMRNEISLQIKESNLLIEKRLENVIELKNTLPMLRNSLKKLEQDFYSSSVVWESSIEIEIENKSRELGQLDEEIKQAYENKKLSMVITELQNQRDNLQIEKNKLEDKIELLEKKQVSIRNEVAEKIGSIMVDLLKEDLKLQKEFIEARDVSFDFIDNCVYVNGSRNFSESSAVVLRHIFHLALLSASIENEYMRVPRFLMLDGIDDGGMEKDRSHNLQKIIVEECANYEHDFQLIYATSEINPEYENTTMVVGEAFSPENRSLKVIL